MSLKRIFGFVFALILSVFVTSHQVYAANNLLSFTVTIKANTILIEWETGTEIDNAGFYLTRSIDNTPPYEDISGYIPAQGSGVIGEEYEFVDDDVTEGTTYFYILEAVDTSQQIEYHGPISITFNAQTTSTPTRTPTRTRTPSPTPGTPTNTPTPTRTRTPLPTNTYTPQPPTLTPTYFTETPTQTDTPSITPSPTLLDAPDLTLVLPLTDTPFPSTDLITVPQRPSLTPTPIGTLAKIVNSGSLTMAAVFCLMILVWAVVAVGIFIYLNKRLSSS